jgi:hypothetical protein
VCVLGSCALPCSACAARHGRWLGWLACRARRQCRCLVAWAACLATERTEHDSNAREGAERPPLGQPASARAGGRACVALLLCGVRVARRTCVRMAGLARKQAAADAGALAAIVGGIQAHVGVAGLGVGAE